MGHESADQTQLKSRRMCLNDTGNVKHVEGSPTSASLACAEHDLCGRLQFIHTKSTARKLLLESDSSGLKRATCASRRINYHEGLKVLGKTFRGV